MLFSTGNSCTWDIELNFGIACCLFLLFQFNNTHITLKRAIWDHKNMSWLNNPPKMLITLKKRSHPKVSTTFKFLYPRTSRHFFWIYIKSLDTLQTESWLSYTIVAVACLSGCVKFTPFKSWVFCSSDREESWDPDQDAPLGIDNRGWLALPTRLLWCLSFNMMSG